MKPIWLAGFLALLSLACKREEEAGAGTKTGTDSKDGSSQASSGARTSKTRQRDGSKKSIPTAEPVPDKPGFVKSPYNGAVVDVSDVAAGSVVPDPGYPGEEDKKFRVPYMAEVEEVLKDGLKVADLPILDLQARVEAPTATVAPGKPGFVVSPWDQREFDASGLEPGALITDPSSTQQAPRFLKIPDDHVRTAEPDEESE